MGGLALKHLEVRRIPAAECRALTWSVQNSFHDLFGQRPVDIPAYAEKHDFGDVDLIVVGSELPEAWRETLMSTHASKGMMRNGSVTSMELYGVQFDFINCKAHDVQWARTYFAYNDLGNLMGRVAHKMRFKFGHEGLVYVLRDENSDQVVAEINVGATPAEAFSFLGYDYTRWLQGFNTLEDVFEFAASTQWFHPDIYLLHNRNAVSRVRDAKRESYTRFLAWCSENQSTLNKYDWDSLARVRQAHQLRLARSQWPEFDARIAQALKNADEANRLKQHWNGFNVAAWTGLSGAALGKFMGMARNHADFPVTSRRTNDFVAFVERFMVTYQELSSNPETT